MTVVSQGIRNAAHRAYNTSIGIDEVIEVVARMAANEVRARAAQDFGPLVAAAAEDFTSEDTASCGDDEAVMTGGEEGSPVRLTFGHIRTAKRALAEMRNEIERSTK
jgi:hypothetical protein